MWEIRTARYVLQVYLELAPAPFQMTFAVRACIENTVLTLTGCCRSASRGGICPQRRFHRDHLCHRPVAYRVGATKHVCRAWLYVSCNPSLVCTHDHLGPQSSGLDRSVLCQTHRQERYRRMKIRLRRVKSSPLSGGGEVITLEPILSSTWFALVRAEYFNFHSFISEILQLLFGCRKQRKRKSMSRVHHL